MSVNAPSVVVAEPLGPTSRIGPWFIVWNRTMGRPVTRWATRDDIAAFSPMRDKPTIRALCIEVDGRIVALGGLAFSQSRWIMFCDVRDEARKFKVALVKASKRMIEEARRMGIRYVYAAADPNEVNSARWMTSLGFKVDPRTPSIYRWSADG